MVRPVSSLVSTAFGKANADNRAALVGYLPAGFPTVPAAIEAALAMAHAGADVIEIGLPYSDPLMDGPVIAEAVHRALAAGTRIADVLRTVEAVAATASTVRSTSATRVPAWRDRCTASAITGPSISGSE